MKLTKSHKIRATVFGVIGFIIVLFFAMRAESATYIGVGKTLFNSDLSVGEIGYISQDNWDFQLMILGEGDTKKGEQNIGYIASVSHLIEPGWETLNQKFFMRLGVAAVDDSPLVGRLNFRLGFGWHIGRFFDLEFNHFSSANIFETNTGLDMLSLRAKF